MEYYYTKKTILMSNTYTIHISQVSRIVRKYPELMTILRRHKEIVLPKINILSVFGKYR